MEQPEVSFVVTFQKDRFEISLPTTATVANLKERLAVLTNVPKENQKLMFKGMLKDNVTIAEAGIKANTKIMLMGTPKEKIEEVITAKVSHEPFIEPFVDHSNSRSNQDKKPKKSKRFHYIAAISGLQKEDEAKALLERIASDPGIVYLMEKYDWNVLYLKELSVAQTDKLGWNVNAGTEISLRLRVDHEHPLEFRDYEEIKDVMLHELTHMVFGPHDNNFHNFNRILHQEIKEFEDREKRYINQDYGDLMKETERRSGLKLGGASGSQNLHQHFQPRELAYAAAVRRLSEQEQRITDGCGGALTDESLELLIKAMEERNRNNT